MCWAGSGGSQAGVGTGSVTLAMSSEAVSRRGRGRGQSLSLLWLLLLPPLATRGLRGSLPMATPALAPGEMLEGGAPTPSAQPLARGAPGTVQGRRALCGVNALHCWAGAWADCGWRPVPRLPEFLLSAFPSTRQPSATRHRWVLHSPELLGLWHPPQLLGLWGGTTPRTCGWGRETGAGRNRAPAE